MSVPAGTLPPSQFKVGAYELKDVAAKRQASVELGLGPVEAKIGGNWKLQAKVAGPTEGNIQCVGPTDWWKNPDKQVHISIGQAKLGCRLDVDGKEWTMLFDVDLNQSGPDVPEWVTALRSANDDGPKDARDWDAVVVDASGRGFSLEWAHQTVRVGNVGGYYAYVDGKIMGAVDVTILGAPKAYVARDAPNDLEPALVTAMAAAYLIVSVN